VLIRVVADSRLFRLPRAGFWDLLRPGRHRAQVATVFDVPLFAQLDDASP
jgi:hypothetical protein